MKTMFGALVLLVTCTLALAQQKVYHPVPATVDQALVLLPQNDQQRFAAALSAIGRIHPSISRIRAMPPVGALKTVQDLQKLEGDGQRLVKPFDIAKELTAKMVQVQAAVKEKNR